MQKTYHPKKEEVKRNWHLMDIKGKVLGRKATKIATLLIGKNKPSYSPHADSGDYVVVTNAKDVVLTGRKVSQKVYYKHSNYPGGLKEVKVKKLLDERPEEVIRKAVSGMLPKNKLKANRLKRLKVFADSNHKYEDRFQK